MGILILSPMYYVVYHISTNFSTQKLTKRLQKIKQLLRCIYYDNRHNYKKPGISAWHLLSFAGAPVILLKNQVIQIGIWIIAIIHMFLLSKNTPGQYIQNQAKNVPYFLDSPIFFG